MMDKSYYDEWFNDNKDDLIDEFIKKGNRIYDEELFNKYCQEEFKTYCENLGI